MTIPLFISNLHRRRFALGVALCGLMLAPLALAAGGGRVPEPVIRDKGDAARGDSLTGVCVACHGSDGNSISSAFPSLAGQGERYLFEQMRAMRDGERPVPLMAGQLDKMSDKDLWDLAAWYSGNEPTIRQSSKASLELGLALYRFGDEKRAIPACSACHGPRARGLAAAAMPSLSGQYSQYIDLALKEYRSGTRNSSANEAMNDISRRLTDADIEALAQFIPGLY